MHVMVVTGGQQLSHIRISFPTVNNVDLPPPEFPNPESFPPTNVNEAGPPPIGTVRRPCHSIGNVELVSDIIRQFFGFTSTKASPAPTSGFVHILPYPGPNRPFFKRIHHALMALGPWEGRAVSFVLGEFRRKG